MLIVVLVSIEEEILEGVNRDITERKKAEEALREARKFRLRRLLERGNLDCSSEALWTLGYEESMV